MIAVSLMNDALADIAARRRFDGFMFDIAGARRCLALAAAVRVKPFHPARPPAALLLACRFEPSLGLRGIWAADPVTAAILGSRIDHAGDVPARAQHESLVI